MISTFSTQPAQWWTAEEWYDAPPLDSFFTNEEDPRSLLACSSRNCEAFFPPCGTVLAYQTSPRFTRHPQQAATAARGEDLSSFFFFYKLT